MVVAFSLDDATKSVQDVAFDYELSVSINSSFTANVKLNVITTQYDYSVKVKIDDNEEISLTNQDTVSLTGKILKITMISPGVPYRGDEQTYLSYIVNGQTYGPYSDMGASVYSQMVYELTSSDDIVIQVEFVCV